MPLSRRAFLQLTGAVALATGLPPARVAQALQAGPSEARAAAELTTMAQRLVKGPVLREGAARTYHAVATAGGDPHVVRDDLVGAQPGREGRRRTLVCFAHLTDQHIIDGQSPSRVEFLDRTAEAACGDPASFSSAWRAHEAASARIADAMLRRIRRIGVSPVTGAPIGAAICTGDNHDNQQVNELGIFLDVMDGGPVRPQSGDAQRYEGVQRSGDVAYWHPDPGVDDTFKVLHGFPEIDGWLDRALAPFDAVGAGMPWYTCYGNHDGLAQGNLPANPAFEAIGVGPLKVVGPPPGNPCASLADLGSSPGAPAIPVTADAARAYVPRREWIRGHLDRPGDPMGHGYTQGNVDANEAYYVADVGAVRWIVLDTVNPGGEASGSIGSRQLAWLVQRLIEAQTERRPVILFSHHGLRSLDNPLQAPDPLLGADNDLPRANSDEVLAAVSNFTCVIAWVNGHTHRNVIEPQPGPFWDIGTAAHIDWPGQARIIEVVDNGDGTLSIFTTLVDHDGGEVADVARELTGNDPRKGFGKGEGEAGDRNAELLIRDPFATAAVDADVPETTPAEPTGDPGEAAGGGGAGGDAPPVAPTRTLPATGPVVPLTLGGALAVAAGGGLQALRIRGERIAAARASGGEPSS
jgi:metallophosphoesterase (TIGR03767 family)